MRRRSRTHYDGTVAFFASGSLSHRFAQNGLAPEFMLKIWTRSSNRLDHARGRDVEARRLEDLLRHAAEYADKGHGEGFMHDTAMLLGALGWSRLRRAGVEIVTPYFGSSGTGQINAVFPVTPQSGEHVPAAVASSASGYQSFGRL